MSQDNKKLTHYSHQSISSTDKNEIMKVFDSEYLTTGDKVEEFESSISKYVKAKHVLAVSSGTAALHLAYKLLGVDQTKTVWTSPISFVATANMALHVGSKIDFVDIDNETLNLSPDQLANKLKNTKYKKDLPDVITVVHFAGNPCDMKKIFSLSQEYNFKIIEDASHALGAKYQNGYIGSNFYSSAATFSFHPVKMITTGEGGAITVKNEDDFKKINMWRSHGITRDDNDYIKKNRPNWYYEQHDLGYNYRLPEMSAALGLSQIKRLEKFVKKRNRLSEIYKNELRGLPLRFQKVSEDCRSSYHLFTIEITDVYFKRDDLYRFLKTHNIGCQVHYIPIYKQPLYKDLGFESTQLFNSERYFNNCLSLPLHYELSERSIKHVSKIIRKFFTI